jgi:hypothetical protein
VPYIGVAMAPISCCTQQTVSKNKGVCAASAHATRGVPCMFRPQVRHKAKSSMQVQAEADAQIGRAEKRAKDAEFLVKHLEREIAALKETNQNAWREWGQVEPLKRHLHHTGTLVRTAPQVEHIN